MDVGEGISDLFVHLFIVIGEHEENGSASFGSSGKTQHYFLRDAVEGVESSFHVQVRGLLAIAFNKVLH